MPHIILDYPEGLDQQVDMAALCQAIFDSLATDPAVPDPSSLKIRARPNPYSVIGTDPQTFVHATLRLLPGRSDDTKLHLTQIILKVLEAQLPNVGSLSVEAVDLHGPSYAKRVL